MLVIPDKMIEFDFKPSSSAGFRLRRFDLNPKPYLTRWYYDWGSGWNGGLEAVKGLGHAFKNPLNPKPSNAPKPQDGLH